MANHKDAAKRNRQNQKKRNQNRQYRTRMRNQIKSVRTAVENGDVATATEQLRNTVSIIQRLAGKGVLHKRQAARRISRLHQAVNAINQ